MIVIDPARGGNDPGASGNGIIEKEYTLLISEYIYNRLKELGADVKIIREDDEYISNLDRANMIKNAYGNNSKVVAISNRLSSRSNEGAEIIYALRNNDTLAESISEELENAGQLVDKRYQRRSESNTSKDYDQLQRETGVVETIIVDYGSVSIPNDASKIKNNWQNYAEAVVKALANYQRIPYYKDGENTETYIVKKGDSLYKIASKYGITVNELKSANNLKSNSLNIGDVLIIPRRNQDTSLNDNETYVVQKGDSLYSVAKKFNTTVNELKKLNNLNNTLIDIGQILIVNKSTANNNSNDNVYVVQRGDSLYVIANRFNTTVDAIKSLNNLNSNLLSIGQTLKIPNRNNNQNIYIVQRGDSLYSIANKFNTTVNKLKSLNNLNSNLLNIGDQLLIP